MDNKNKIPFEIRPDDFVEIKKELKREGKKQGLVIKSLNVISYPAKRLKRRYQVRYKFNKKHLIFDLILAGAVVFLAVSIFFYWWGGFHYFGNKFEMKITTSPQQIISGDEINFIIDYANNNSFQLDLGTLTVVFPQNFILQESSRPDFNRQTNTLFVGDLEPGANGRLVLSGIVIADIDKSQELVANYTYYKTNKTGVTLWGQFQEIQRFIYQLQGSVLGTQITWPQRLVNNQEFILPIKITNNFSQEIDEIKIEPGWQADIQYLQTQENFINNAWYFYQVKPGQEIQILPKLELTSQALSKNFTFNTYIKYNDQYLKQSVLEQRIDIFNPQFVVSHTVDRQNITPGDWVEVKVKLENQNGYNVEDAILTLDLDGDFWDLSQIQGLAGKIQGQSIVWTPEEFSRLTLISPASSEELLLKIKTKHVAGKVPNLKITSSVSFEVEGLRVEQSGNQTDLKVSSNLNLKAFARYYTPEGDQLGRGPLPPKANETTKYWVFIQILNDINPMQDVKLTASLPANVSWENRTSVPVGEAIEYSAGKIYWQIPKVKTDPQNIGIAFEVALTPSAKQQGQPAALVENIQVSGQDTNTGQIITHQVPQVTTELIYDEIGSQKSGLVQ